jgi:hypothetical protein
MVAAIFIERFIVGGYFWLGELFWPCFKDRRCWWCDRGGVPALFSLPSVAFIVKEKALILVLSPLPNFAAFTTPSEVKG